MNKIYNVKWSKRLKAYVVCSEISKLLGKSAASALVISMAFFPSMESVLAQEVICIPNATDGSYLPTRGTKECNTIAPTAPVTQSGAAGFFMLSRKTAGSTLTIKDVKLTADVSDAYTVIGNQYQVGGNINMGNLDATYKSKANASGVGSHDLVNITAKNVTLNAEANYSDTARGGETYGVLAGSSVISGINKPASNGKFTTITMDNLNLNQKVTGGKQPVLNSGLRSIQGAYQDAGNGDSGKIVINQQLNMTLTGNRIEGIYVSGSASDAAGVEAVSQAVLNNSNIKLIQPSTTDNQSSAIKIGKARTVGTGKGAVYSSGVLNIDASEAIGDAIKLYDSGSILQADSATSKTNVLANRNVIAYGPSDWQVTAGKAARDNKVLLNNANLNTINETASLVKVYQNQTNAELGIKGAESILTAADKAWLIEVGKSSTATANLENGKYFGLTSKDATASLTMNLSDGGTWYLKKNNLDSLAPEAASTSTFNVLNMTSGAVLNAANNTTAEKKTIEMHDKYSMSLPDPSALTVVDNTVASNFFLKGDVNSTDSTITFQNKFAGDVLTIDGNYVGTNGNVLFDTQFGDDTSPTDLLKVTGSTSGMTFLSFNNVGGSGDMTNIGIKVVDVVGNSPIPSFLLKDNTPVVVNGFTYYLYRGTGDNNNWGDDTDNNDWYLRSVCSSGSSTTGGTSTGTDALGCAPNDTIVVQDDASVNTIEGAGGADTIHVLSNASVTGDILGGGEGKDFSAATDMGDIILVNTTGTVGGKVDGGMGDDSITISGASTVNGAIIGGLGNDTLIVTDTAKVGSLEGNEDDDAILISQQGQVLGTMNAGAGNDTITLSDFAKSGAIDAGEGDDTFTWSGNAIAESFQGGLGSDTATVSSKGYTGAQILDGGDDTSVADGFIDTLSLNGLSVTANGGDIRNWEVINLNNTALNLSGTLSTGKDAGTGLSIHTGSTLATAGGNVTVAGNVNNSGMIDLSKNQATAGQTLTVQGNYHGTQGALKFDTVFGGDDSLTDKMVVTGDTSGTSNLHFTNVGGTGALTKAGIKVIDVGGKSADGSFLLVDNAPIMINGFSYYLYRGTGDNNKGGDALTNNDWYLRSVCESGSSTTGGSSTGTDALGCAPNDTIVVQGDASVNKVEGAGGADTIHILDNASVVGDILGGGEGQDFSAATDMGDTILVNTTGTVGGKVDGGIGDDLITVTGASTVTGAVIGGLGKDSIAIGGTANIGSIQGNEGDDSIAITENAIVKAGLDAGVGNDTISVLNAAKVIGTIITGAGDDTIKLANTAVVADVQANEGNDTITVSDSAKAGAIDAGAGKDIITVSNKATTGAIKAGEGDDTFTWSGTSTISSFDGGLGSDVTTVSSTGYTGAQILDGGDDTSVADGFIDTLSLNGLTVTANGGNIRNWEVINLNNTALNLSGTLSTGKDAGTGLSIHTGSTLVTAGGNVTVAGNVMNSGTIDLNKNDPTPGQSLKIDGDYLGVAGSRLIVDTTWNNPNAVKSDILGITGTASGATQLTVPGGIMGNVTQADQIKISAIPVVTVGKAHKDNVFTGAAATTNAGEAQLVKIGNDYFWTLFARDPGPNPEPPTPIRPQVVPGYLLGQYANMEMGFSQLGKLHERVSEQQTWAWDDCGTRCDQYNDAKAKGEKPYPLWARLHLNRLDLRGKERFEVESKTGFLQIGSDLHVSTNIDANGKQNRRHTGAMFTYGWGAHDFYDRNRAVNGLIVPDKYAGKASTDMWSLGAFSTWYAENGTYLDLVGNVSYIRNKYTSRDALKKSQSGYGAAVSAEVGRPYQLGDSNWLIEPQAQLSYQMVHLKGFNDGIREVSSTNLHGLRGRLGARLAWNDQTEDLRTKTLYMTANVLHDFSGSKPSIKLGSEKIDERMNKTWFEVGLGGQAALSKSTYVYADVRYQHALGSKPKNSSSPAREGVHGQVGLRYSW